MSRLSGTESAASLIQAEGPLGASTVQEALDLLAAAGPFYTTVNYASYVLGTGSNYTTLQGFSLDPGLAYSLVAIIELAGGTAAAPTAAFCEMVASAYRPSASGAVVSSPAIQQSSSIAGFTCRWFASGNSGLIQCRATGGPTVRARLKYSWLQLAPP